MNREWNDSQPIYRQLRDRGVHMILDGVLKEGDPLPSVRNVAAEYRVNPLTVLKAYQQLVDEELVEMKRGLGMFVKAGARDLLLKGERQKFLAEEWPQGRGKDSAAWSDPERTRCRRREARFQRKREGALIVMATIEARGLRKVFGTTVALDNVDLACRRGPHSRTDRSKRRRQNDRAQCDSRSHLIRWKIVGARARSMECARRAHVRCLFHCRCRGAAALDPGYAGARLCRRRASAIRSREGGKFSGQDRRSSARAK